MSAYSIRKALIITAAMVSMIPHLGHAADAPIEVKQISSPGSGFPGVIIANITDDVTVTNVIFNRGNCGRRLSHGVTSWPAKLKFGETVSLHGTTPCNLVEVSVSTNKGDWTFKWN